ncbi:MAG: hypothetical protein M3O09_02605 [Acidobacteriota bacterium]|nr:hypothetical protein [Acidobacteriota bacterium]
MKVRTGLTGSGIMLLVLGMWPSAHSQTKNEVGLVIGATVTPSLSLSQGGTFAASANDLTFNRSLTLGAEFDRRLATAKGVGIDGGVDYLASPFDVKLAHSPAGVSPEYAYEFLTPHVRLKFHSAAAVSPWVSFGGGVARFLEKKPTTGIGFKPGTNTGTLEFGGGIDTSTALHVLRIPVGFRFEVRDFYSGLPNYNRKVNASFQNNVAITGSLLVRF